MNPSETDLVDQLRRLRGEARGHTVSPGFADAVLARVRRRARARARVAGASALVMAVAVGVVVPLRVAGPWAADVADTNAASPSVHSHGGFAVTWLPAGLRPRNDLTPTFDGAGGFTFEDSQDDPLFVGSNGMLAGFVHEQGPTTFTSQFTTLRDDAFDMHGVSVVTTPTDCAPGSTCPPREVTSTLDPATFAAEPGPASVWVSVTWRPETVHDLDSIVARVETARERSSEPSNMEIARDTVGGRPAVLISDTGLTAPYHIYDQNLDRDFSSVLSWITPDGVWLAVEAAGPTPIDPAVLRRIADGVVLGQMPTIPNYTPPAYQAHHPDATTTALATTALNDTFGSRAQTGDASAQADRFEAAMQDGRSLLAVRARTEELLPALVDTFAIRVDELVQVSPDTIEASLTVSFLDPTVLPGMNTSALPLGVTVIRTSAGWQVSSDSYCGYIRVLGVPGLSCEAVIGTG